MKFVVTTAAVALIAASLSGAGHAAEAREIGWEELTGPTTPIENPFETLTTEQMENLARVLRLDTIAEEDNDKDAAADAKALRGVLYDQGVKVDFLLSERLRIMAQLEAEASAPNAEVVGKTIRIPGYLLPLEMNGDTATEFLLVPTIGACIHVPPPPANQIVRVSYPEGFETDGYYTPIWITGELRNEPSVSELFLVDGSDDVSATYQLKATSVELYE
ncbi:DUF3299 domain-containing protein [Shimia sp. MMG029]|uniref:DUF3299 domain-containing protein n=1 Tax=Shimia sp. MMG029 TaxID=3021978 RepID=UPI0022FF2F59|nr:DUF3299 domain-containing protein [Shimia sp. MMG029]MDA5555299.1 DUF3299 domain-containing protein [Shimia sp. MMG029]